MNPVPKLLIATETGILLAEADNIANTSVTMVTKPTLTMAYLAQEDVLYWINRDMYLEEYHQSKTKRVSIDIGKRITILTINDPHGLTWH